MLRYSRVGTSHGGIDDYLAWGLLGRRKDEGLKRLSSGGPGGSRVVFEAVASLTALQHVSAPSQSTKHIAGAQPCTSGLIVEPHSGLGMIQEERPGRLV